MLFFSIIIIIILVTNDKLLGNTHVHIFVREFEPQDLLGYVQDNWVSLGLDQEVENVLCSGNYGNEENDEIHKAVITNLN